MDLVEYRKNYYAKNKEYVGIINNASYTNKILTENYFYRIGGENEQYTASFYASYYSNRASNNDYEY